jgi:RHS repeat-associated protein
MNRLAWLQTSTATKSSKTASKPVSKSIAKKQLNTSASAETSNKNSIKTTTVRYTYDALGRRLQKQVIRDAEATPETTPETTHFGWDGDRLVSTETASSKTHTVYEPGSFVPLLRISQVVGAGSPKSEAEATEANARGLLALASQHGKPAKSVNPDDTAKAPIQLPGFGTAQWAALSSSFAQVAQKGYPEHMKTILRQGGLDPDKLTEMAKAAVAQQQAEDTAKLTIQMYHCNHLGTPIALINQSGLIDWAVELDPWGNVLNEFNPNNIDQPIRMQGQQIDRESGLFYNRHRYYDPQMGRYITQDPIGLAGGVNNYCYPNNPMQMVDPLGLEGETGLGAMNGRVDAAQAGGTGVRLGGAKVQLAGAEIKASAGDGKIGNASTSKVSNKPAKKSADIISIGKPCVEEEIGFWSISRKWFKQEQKVTNRAETRQLGGNVSGPGVSADLLCVDPGKAVNYGTGAIAGAIANSPTGKAVSGESWNARMDALEKANGL